MTNLVFLYLLFSTQLNRSSYFIMKKEGLFSIVLSTDHKQHVTQIADRNIKTI